MFDDGVASGTGLATPPGLTNIVPTRRQSALAALNSSFTPTLYNELRAAFTRYATTTNAQNPAVAERIPSIEISELGLTGFNADSSRTAIGLGVNLPQYRRNNTYQLQDSVSWITGTHTVEVRHRLQI
jgi:hypothetical protein